MNSGGIGGSVCLADVGVGVDAHAGINPSLPLTIPRIDAKNFRSTNSLLPPGVQVGFYYNSSESESIGDGSPLVCLGEDSKNNICYKNKPMIHRILSFFELKDYLREGGNSDRDNEEDDEEEGHSPSTLTLQDIPNLVPGTTLDCWWPNDDFDGVYEAIFIMAADQRQQEGFIAVQYIEDEYSAWIPVTTCDEVELPSLYPCFEGADGVTIADSNSSCDYMTEGNNPLFHRAFRLLDPSVSRTRKPPDVMEKSLFLYAYFNQIQGTVGIEDRVATAETPPWMDHTLYSTIYSHLPFEHELVREVDRKFSLYQLYKDDPRASKVFPKSYGRYGEALKDTEEEHMELTKDGGETDVIFYVKSSGGTRGEEIEIYAWADLQQWYEMEYGEHVDDDNDEEGKFDYEEDNEGEVIIQKAVTDLYTIDGNGPIADRRFDIRFFVLIANGKAYLHSNMWCKWVYGVTYDPHDTDVRHQVSNLAVYGGGDTARLIFPDVLPDAHGNPWKNHSEKRRSTNSSSNSKRHKGADPHGWRDALADALDDAIGVFGNLMNHTQHDPTKYVLAGGDAMILQDGSAILVEFNIWPDLASKYHRLNECLSGEGCRRMVLLLDDNDEESNRDATKTETETADNYHVTEHTPVTDIVSSEALAGVLRDTASLVMKVETVDEIGRFRQLVSRTKQD